VREEREREREMRTGVKRVYDVLEKRPNPRRKDLSMV